MRPSSPTPHKGVHVWQLMLAEHASSHSLCQSVFSADEQERAARFHFEEHRNDFLIARAFLRTVLGAYLKIEPAAVQFVYNEFGKPSVPAGPENNLFFNLSHSNHVALLAVTRETEVGVDIEQIRSIEPGLAERYFSATEIRALQQLPKDLYQEGFFNCWTRKEAYIKARGKGLSLPLDKFDVSLAPGQPARMLQIRDSEDQASSWQLAHLTPARGFVGAVAMRSNNLNLTMLNFESF